MLKHTKADHPPDLFFVDVLGVPPPRTRPCQMTGEIMTLHPQSTALQKVIESVIVLKQIMQVRLPLALLLPSNPFEIRFLPNFFYLLCLIVLC
jgi:hypothetical protein